jgi:hypothetical protein
MNKCRHIECMDSRSGLILFTLVSASLVFPMIWQWGHSCPLRIPPALRYGGCGLPHCQIMENTKGLRQ